MEITFKIDGGMAAFPGLRRPTIIDTECLPTDEAATLTHLVARANFFDLPTSPKTYPKAADLQSYTISIRDDERNHQVRVVDPIGDPDVVALIDCLKSYTKTKRT